LAKRLSRNKHDGTTKINNQAQRQAHCTVNAKDSMLYPQLIDTQTTKNESVLAIKAKRC
jgi:hypothetical protein